MIHFVAGRCGYHELLSWVVPSRSYQVHLQVRASSHQALAASCRRSLHRRRDRCASPYISIGLAVRKGTGGLSMTVSRNSRVERSSPSGRFDHGGRDRLLFTSCPSAVVFPDMTAAPPLRLLPYSHALAHQMLEVVKMVQHPDGSIVNFEMEISIETRWKMIRSRPGAHPSLDSWACPTRLFWRYPRSRRPKCWWVNAVGRMTRRVCNPVGALAE